MRSLLDTDGVLYRALSRWYELVLLSLGWFVLSLPVVTLPAATDWLVDGVRRTGRGEPIRGVGDSLRFVARRWLPTARLAGMHLLVLGLLAVGAFGPSPGGPFGLLVLVGVVGVAATWALVAPWSVVLLDRYGARDALRAAYLRALRHLPLSFLSAVAVLGGITSLVWAPAVVRLPVVLTAPGLVAALVIMVCDRADPTRTRATRFPSASVQRTEDALLPEGL